MIYFLMHNLILWRISKMNKTKNIYCVLRIPKTTRSAIQKIAKKRKWKPRWTDMANQMLLKEIEKYKKEKDS